MSNTIDVVPVNNTMDPDDIKNKLTQLTSMLGMNSNLKDLNTVIKPTPPNEEDMKRIRNK